MKNIKFQHIAALLAVGFLIWMYFDSRKKAMAAADVKDTVADSTSDTVKNVQSQFSAETNSGTGNIIILPPPVQTTGYTRSYTSGFYGNVAAGGGGTSMNNSDPTLNGSGGGATLGGGGTSQSGATF